jgi:hypothetical protein
MAGNGASMGGLGVRREVYKDKPYVENKEISMAAIDKIYATKEQYEEFYAWCKRNKPEALIFFYDWLEEWDDGEKHPITIFPVQVDKWMLKNCPLKWVTDYIKFQHGIVSG